MYVKGLEITLHDGSSLDDTVIDEMLALRAQFMTLQPGVDPDVDRALFAEWIHAPGNIVTIARDRAGRLQTFLDMNARRITHAGRAHLVCYANFLFASPAYRNHPAYALGNFRNLLGQIRRHHGPPTMWAGAVYPTSFNVGARTFPKFWALGEPNVPAPLTALAERLALEVFGDSWNPNTQLVRQRTLPPPMTTGSDEARALFARYEARNPNWREGWGLLCVAPFTASNMFGAARLMLRRPRKRTTGRSRNRPG